VSVIYDFAKGEILEVRPDVPPPVPMSRETAFPPKSMSSKGGDWTQPRAEAFPFSRPIHDRVVGDDGAEGALGREPARARQA